MRRNVLSFLTVLATAGMLILVPARAQKDDPEKAAPYYPTPQIVAERMLQMGGLKKGETVYDLGSGDGRIVITAAQKFGAKAIGVELDKELAAQSGDRIRRLGIESNARIIEGDLFKQDYSSADLITVYLLPVTNVRLAPILEKMLKKGARLVCHDFEFMEWNPEKTESMEDQEGRSHTLFLYRR